jgi:hypothetical protein
MDKAIPAAMVLGQLGHVHQARYFWKRMERIMSNYSIFRIIIVITFIFFAVANAGEVYRWVDENGVTRFSDSPTDRNALIKNNAKPSPIFEQKTSSTGSNKKVTYNNNVPIVDLIGEWDALIESCSEWGKFGTYANVARISQDKDWVDIKFLKELPQSSMGSFGKFLLFGRLDKNGFNELSMNGPISEYKTVPIEGQISEDGNKIYIDATQRARITLTRK